MRFRSSILLSLLVAPQLLAQCAPPGLVRIVTQDESPNIHVGSFAALPRTVYRLGARYARVEEQPDPERKMRGLIVVDWPDSWIANLADGTGRHVVDPDPNGKVSVTLFRPGTFSASFPEELTRIQMGCEVVFFDSHHSPAKVVKTAVGERVQQAVGVGDWMLVLLRRSVNSSPDTLFVFHGNDIIYALRYLSYEELPSPDMKLFSRPESIAFTER